MECYLELPFRTYIDSKFYTHDLLLRSIEKTTENTQKNFAHALDHNVLQ